MPSMKRKPRSSRGRGSRTGSMKLYKSYMFRGKDPSIDQLRTVIQDETGDQQISNKTLTRIEADGGPTVSCMDNWFRGDTKRPQNATIEAAGRALGLKRVWVKNKEK
jgi:hypothetical protein